MSIEPITIPMSIEVNDVTIDSTIETNEVTIESTFDAKIEVVEGGDITVQSLTVTENGTTTAPTGKAYSPVIVNVPASAVDAGTKNITSNGTHDVVGYASAAVIVPNTYTASDEGKVVDSGALVSQTSTTVTTNGTYDTTTNDEVVVNVSGGTPTLITKTITENGTYSAEDDDADGYSEVTVNVGGGSILPSGYTQIDFVFANGTQYIITNYSPVQNDHISAIFSKTSNGALFGAGTGSYQWILLDNYYRYFSGGNATTFNPGISSNRVYELEADSTATAKSVGLTTSTATMAYEHELDGTNTVLNIFRRGNGSQISQGYLYRFTVTNNGTKKMDLIPCIQDSTGIAGMYDIISDVFYSSDGSGEFYAGPEVINDSEALSIMLGGE